MAQKYISGSFIFEIDNTHCEDSVSNMATTNSLAAVQSNSKNSNQVHRTVVL